MAIAEELDGRLDVLEADIAELKRDLTDVLEELRSHLETCPGAAPAVDGVDS